jgi:hypothetical protein
MMLLAPYAWVAEAAAFAPPGTPVRVITERVQRDETGSKTFRVERLVRFAREAAGWRAEVLMLSASSDAPADTASMFDAGFTGLAGKTLVFHLDNAGKVLSLDDREALWRDFCDGIAKAVAASRGRTDAERSALAARIAQPLRALPPERQFSAMASLIDVLVYDEATTPGTRPVRLPARSALGASVTLEGTRTLSRAGNRIHIVTRAEGDVEGGHMRMDLERDMDPATGLNIADTETVVTRLGEGAAARESSRVSTVRIDPLPASAWPR